MKTLCDVPNCNREGVEEVHDGWMCRAHAIRWDRANAKSEIAPPDLYVENEGAPDREIFDEGHARWLGRMSR